jgi:sialate O-acetylesterase
MSAKKHPLPTLALALQALGLLAGCVAPAAGPVPRTDVSLAPLFADHAVLQRDKPVPVWGRAGAGDAVTVSFHGQTVRAVAGPDGRWTASLAPMPASAEPADLVVQGASTLTLHDVVVGEVWLCSGQSNMEFTVDDGAFYQVRNHEREVAAANYPLIRQLKVERTVAAAPADSVKTSGWKPAVPANVGGFTAVGYFFARDIQRAIGVPIGIIDSPWGGTPVESWMSDEARRSTALSAVIDERWKKALSEWPPERVAQYPAAMEAWRKAEENARATHTKNPLPWPPPPATADSPNLPGGLYNAMIAPLEPGAMRGILWYQGESNIGHAGEYAELFKAMITSWRAGFRQGDLPFYFVQIANFGNEEERADRGWARLREAQAGALSLPNTGMAVTVDIGEAQDVHPKNKQELGRRLALMARAQVYGVLPEFQGPAFAGAGREGAAMRVRFTHAGNELEARGGPVTALEVAGADKVFHDATGVIDVDTLIVSCPDVPEPVAVRYAWTNAPRANLYGDNGLPAAPFRSDAW